MLKGGCYCGQVRYEVSGPTFHEANCHCSICRRTTGAPFVAWFSVARSGFTCVKGTATRFTSTDKATRSFCPACGTQLFFEAVEHPDEIDISTCSLDDPEQVPPKEHIYVSTKLSWVKLGDRLRAYDGARTS